MLLGRRILLQASASASTGAGAASAAKLNSRVTEYTSKTQWTIGTFPPERAVQEHSTPNPFKRPPAPRKQFMGDKLVGSVGQPLLIAVQHNNMTFEEWTTIRKQLSAVGADARVARSVLLRARIVKEMPGADGERLGSLFRGPTAVVSCGEASPPKLKAIFDVISKQPKLTVLGGRFESRVVSVADIGPISNLPPLDILRGQLLGLLQSPAQSLVGLLQMPAVYMAATLDQASKAKETPAGEEKEASS